MVGRKAESPKTELVVAKIDEKLVDEAVGKIKSILDDTVAKGALSVGEYVLKTFFDDDLEQVRSRDAKKAASFRALAERCGTAELPISKSWLHAAVSVVAMRRDLPQAENFKALPPSHQTALLPLREKPDTAEKLAQRAINKNLSVRDLRVAVSEEVAKARDDDAPPRGRPRTPTVVRTLDRTAALFDLAGGRRAFTKAEVSELDDEQARAALKTAKTLLTRLEDLIGKLEAR